MALSNQFLADKGIGFDLLVDNLITLFTVRGE